VTPTYSTTQVAHLVDRSEQWVRAVSARDGLGHKEGRSWRYTAGELRQVSLRVDPDERRGRPRTAQVGSKFRMQRDDDEKRSPG